MGRSREPAGEAVRRAVAALSVTLGCPVDGRCLVGVSGGRDSMVLLDALTRAGYRRLVVCHLDHGLRGRASLADARFVQKTAERLKLAAVIEQVDVAAAAKECRISLETAAREARRTFFLKVARTRRCRTLLLAHHADDQVETVLFNLCRGTGGTGLAGMMPVSEWPASTPLRVVRPLLGIWRQEIDAYAREHKVAFREDATNTDPAHTRNRVRHEVIPLLDEVFGRMVGPSIWRAADILAAEETWMRETLRSRLEAAADTVELPWKPLATAAVAVQRRVLRAWLKARGVAGVGYEEVEHSRTLLHLASGPAKINLPGGLCVRRRAGVLFVTQMNSATH